jgi:ATP-dependent helicase/nuclease subunit A
MYVAATRARDLLVVSAYAGDLGERKAWGPLEKGFGGVPELPEYPPVGGAAVRRPAPRGRKTDIVRPDEAMKARSSLQRKLAEASMAGALHETVTSLAKRDREPPEWAKGGLGLWGSEVHVMLKALGDTWPAAGRGETAPVVDDDRLLRMARNALVAAERDPAKSRELAGLVGAIVRSGFWLRAMRSERRFLEVPFSVMVGPEDAEYGDMVFRAGLVPLAGGRPVVLLPGAPVFLSGAIDLLFKEKDGWVIADYKTDRIPDAVLDKGPEEAKRALDALVEYYRPQVQLYSRFWEKITGEKVKESGLYFTAHETWFKVEKA